MGAPVLFLRSLSAARNNCASKPRLAPFPLVFEAFVGCAPPTLSETFFGRPLGMFILAFVGPRRPRSNAWPLTVNTASRCVLKGFQ
jgi:hypothetical protein